MQLRTFNTRLEGLGQTVLQSYTFQQTESECSKIRLDVLVVRIKGCIIYYYKTGMRRKTHKNKYPYHISYLALFGIGVLARLARCLRNEQAGQRLHESVSRINFALCVSNTV